MNFLAHCFLAQPNGHSLVGNLLGDFCKGVDTNKLPREIYLGLVNHRAVDKFTDQHCEILQAKQYFSAHRRRFAGIAIDVLFDHFLIKHWSAYSAISFNQFKKQTYQYLIDSLSLMPVEMARVMTRVVKLDWFANYEHLDGVGLALDRIASRIRFRNQFSGCIEDLELHLDALDRAFCSFFPQLQAHIHTLALEKR